jgi:hypothetical protein
MKIAWTFQETVVALPSAEYEARPPSKPCFSEFLLQCPTMDEGFEIERQKDQSNRPTQD